MVAAEPGRAAGKERDTKSVEAELQRAEEALKDVEQQEKLLAKKKAELKKQIAELTMDLAESAAEAGKDGSRKEGRSPKPTSLPRKRSPAKDEVSLSEYSVFEEHVSNPKKEQLERADSLSDEDDEEASNPLENFFQERPRARSPAAAGNNNHPPTTPHDRAQASRSPRRPRRETRTTVMAPRPAADVHREPGKGLLRRIDEFCDKWRIGDSVLKILQKMHEEDLLRVLAECDAPGGIEEARNPNGYVVAKLRAIERDSGRPLNTRLEGSNGKATRVTRPRTEATPTKRVRRRTAERSRADDKDDRFWRDCREREPAARHTRSRDVRLDPSPPRRRVRRVRRSA
eukprot:TRINITY_DN101950_c0_g1_i1.p1 TRINITY_DN101950_c0_g1~~TRINITY_DN101950_c0_g1_i1.p1  ORF type:complete len:344 (-),score=92.21 TRINITY_DN101950_c0_g1_i1:52-1083(-)